ncbi:MAG: hypothetical protein V1872_00890 [bacterium]
MEKINWIFGRGASIACGLDWQVPEGWKSLPRESQIEKIKKALRHEMENPNLDTSLYSDLLTILSSKTNNGCNHRFITTNWDYLLQREILRLNLRVLPCWLDTSHVYHLNGTVEEPESEDRSPFLLETDPPQQRKPTFEANMAYNKLIWDSLVIVVGMSFKCKMDQYLLQAIGEANLSKSLWIIVDQNKEVIKNTSNLIRKTIPYTQIQPVYKEFKEWVTLGFPELIEKKILSN